MAAASTLEGPTQLFVENKSLVSVVGDSHRNPKRVRMMATRLQIPFVFVTVSMVYTLLNGGTDYGFAAGIFYWWMLRDEELLQLNVRRVPETTFAKPRRGSDKILVWF